MRTDSLDILFGDGSRVEFMNKFGLSKTSTVEYITYIRREFNDVCEQLCYLGETQPIYEVVK